MKTKSVSKFVLLSLIGVFLFFVPVKNSKVPVVLLTDTIKALLGSSLGLVVVISCTLLALGLIGARIFHIKALERYYNGDPLIKMGFFLASAVLVWMVTLNVDLPFIRHPEIGGKILTLASTVFFTIALAGTLVIFIIRSGIVEFVSVLCEPIMRPIITTLLFTGMRIGELLALQWKHIDFATHTITIAQSVTRELTFDENGKTMDMTDVLGSTKTRTSHRVIQAPELVLNRLREWMRYVETLPKGLEVLTPEGFVFISTRTMSMQTYSGFRASYRHFLDRNGFSGEGLNLHRYRHTYASMLLEQEINPKIVQKLLGHRDVSTTLGIYTHVVPEVFAGVAAAVDTASQQLMDGTYTPKRSAEAVRAQLQQIDPMLSEDMTVNLKYL